jgi:predicted negative regulator of RcsB-dependent stress response
MSKSNETPSAPSGDDRNLVTTDESVAAPDLEENVHQFLEKNRFTIFAVSVVVVLAIFGRYGWQWMQASQITAEREAFASVSTDGERQAFAAEHTGSQLGGVALLQVADNAFAEGRFDDAIAAYDSAQKTLADGVLGSRIRLGRAMAQIQKGDVDGGQSALRDVANDLSAARSVRAEAAYHLASIAAAKSDGDELAKLVTQLNGINPASTWAQRASILQASLPAVAAADSEVSFGTP